VASKAALNKTKKLDEENLKYYKNDEENT